MPSVRWRAAPDREDSLERFVAAQEPVIEPPRTLLGTTGLVEIECAEWPTRLQFASWVERMRTPADRVAVIRSLQDGAPREIREALAIGQDGSFTIRTGLFWLHKPA